jgi:hypothetical protein
VVAFLACCFFGCEATDDFDDDRPHRPIELASGAIDTSAVEPASSDTLTSDGSGEYLIVQFEGPATGEDLATLAASVDQIYGYLPPDSFLVRVAPGQPTDSLGAWVGAYRPEYKIGRDLRAAADAAAFARGAADDAEAMQTVMVQAYPDADLDRIAAEVARLPDAELVGMGPGRRFLRARLRVPAHSVVSVAEALSALPEVFWIDVEGQRVLLNDTTIWVGQSGLAAGQSTPLFDRGIHGEGQVVGVIDSGVDVDSCYFRDPARPPPTPNLCDAGTVVDPDHRKLLGVDFLWATECADGVTSTEWDTRGHGTHVAGTIAGDNFANPIAHDAADGMAPGAKLIVQDAGAGTDTCGGLPGIGCPVVDLNPIFEQAYLQGARLHSNSWGDRPGMIPRNRYTAASEDVDEFMWAHPDFLIFFAAGNFGNNPSTVISPSTAKNVISVGATLRGTQAEGMPIISSCGPTADGRIKPDLTLPGAAIVSARSDGNIETNNCTSIAMTGTSQAAPGAAGLGALVRQYYTDGFYPSGAAAQADGFTPTAALVKATMLNSAKRMTGTGAGTMPGNCQGWGRVLLDAGLYFEGDNRRLFATDDAGFAQGAAGEERTFTFVVEEGESLKATLVWTDFPSTPAASINLVNDLDLEVTGPPGTFLGNVFSGGVSQTGGTADRRNTVEQVLLETPAAGVYTIRVRAFNVPVGPQAFSLVVTGDSFVNQPPVADAGADRSGNVGVAVALDGSGSTDPDGLPAELAFSWIQTAGPTATLTGADTAAPSFTPTELGTYTFRLLVSDGADESEDTVTVTIVNQPPVADAGDDASGNVGVEVVLDGSGSSDPDEVPSPLTYAWEQTGGPGVTLTGADTAQARFTPTQHGTYTFRLTVSDGDADAEDTVVVSIVNQLPVADAGPDRSGQMGDLIVLDGSGSSDPDGQPSPLSFAWTQLDGPAVTLAGADTPQASFNPTGLGTYTFRLAVSDGAAQAEDTVSVTIVNRAPTAEAGPDQMSLIGLIVELNGGSSNDPDDLPSPLSFAWTQIAGPEVTLTGADSVQASFTAAALGTYTFRLVVSDGAAPAEDTVTVTVVNQVPIADAGPDGSGFVGQAIALDGSGSSDPDGVPSPLSFAWTQTGGPAVTLTGAETAEASFTATALGTYTFQLVVSDGAAQAEDTVTVTIANQGPTADAGPDRLGVVGGAIVLDGTGSSDPDGLPSPLAFAWTQTGGAAVTLAGAETAQPSFTPVALGTYTFQLTVSDGAAQAEDSVVVTVVNQDPTANAGPDQSGLVGVAVVLDGTGSSDPDGLPSPLSFAWTQTAGPAVDLIGASAELASFTPAALGTYTFRLVVSDGAAQAEDTVTVTIANQGPTADAGPDHMSLVGLEVVLDGSASSDPDGAPEPLAYEWTQTGGPAVTLAGAATVTASFTPTVLGTYTFRLVVSDGAAQAEDTVTVTVVNQMPIADAGPDQNGQVGVAVVLDGSGSSDPDAGPSPLAFAWTQTAGPSVSLTGANTAQASFTPAVSGTYEFRLVVTDGFAEDEDTVTVTVPASNVVVFSDDFEQDRGWTANPSGTDTADTGFWERGVPVASSFSGVPLQLATPVSGSFDLVTGASGAAAGSGDIDGGVTTIRSPAIALPAGQITLSLSYYMAHLSNSSSADFLRVRVVGATTQTVLEELGAPNNDGAAWQSAEIDISAFAGQTVRILIEAADASTASLVEAAVDDVIIEALL